MMWNLGWISSTPDADNFYQPLYSANIGLSNDARLRLPEFDRLYEKSRGLPDGAQRHAIYRRMNELIEAYAPWILGYYTYNNTLQQPWVHGFKLNPYLRNQWKYYAVTAHP
jgi:ABC-type transport system substrate-binding protein